jgi:two-component system LytT family response regulator
MQEKIEALKSNLGNEQTQKIAVPVSDGLVFIKVTDITHINADGSYSQIYLGDGSNMLVSKKLKYFEERLTEKAPFYRVHRSHLVNLKHIQKYNRHQGKLTMENNLELNVARDNKTAFEKTLNDFHQ